MSRDLPGAPLSPRRAWISSALLCLALLILPGLALVLVPRPGGFTKPPAPVAARALPEANPPAPPLPVAPSEPPKAQPTRVSTDEKPSDAPVTGVVLDPNGKPVHRAFIGCDDRDKELNATTDDEGHFTLAAEAGGCLAIARSPRFSPSERVQLRAGRENVVRLSRGGAIAGDAVDERGAPLPSYLLAIESFVGASEAAAASPPFRQTRSIQDAKGAFLLEDLPPGKYVLTASAEGRPPTKTSSIEVESGRTTHHVHLVLTRGATLSGKVIDAATRKPISGALVALDAATSTSANLIAPARTDDSGAYSLEGAPAGLFSIRVAHESYRAKIVPGLVARGSAMTQDVELQPNGDGGAGGTELVGIGAVLAPQPKGVTISFLIPGGPAAGADLRNGDVITRIDGVDAQGLSMSDCVQRLRGPEGSRVTVRVSRDEQIIDVTMTRKVVVSP